MELAVKTFQELTADELYELLRLRAEVFVVEQTCVYQDLDGRDRAALHLLLREGETLQAYARVLPAGTAFPTAGLGRVCTRSRGRGLGRAVVAAGIRAAREKLGAEEITIEAQSYVRGLYEGFGFRQSSEEFLEDGIPHIQMKWKLQADGQRPPIGGEPV